MQTDVSVKKPTRRSALGPYVSTPSASFTPVPSSKRPGSGPRHGSNEHGRPAEHAPRSAREHGIDRSGQGPGSDPQTRLRWTPRASRRDLMRRGIGLDQLSQGATARPSPGADITGRGLDLLNVDVRVERDREEVVGRVAGGQTARAPVIWNADVVDGPAVDSERLHSLGYQHARLDRRPRRHDRGPAAVLEPALVRQLGRDFAEERRL